MFAASEAPVSVSSTIASTSSGTFTSVAPQENSTSASTPASARYCFVTLTTSVAMRFPARSFGELIGLSWATTSTQRAGPRLAFEYTRSQTSATSAPVSIIQSRPLRPASSLPAAT